MSSIEDAGTVGATELSPLNPGTLFHGRYQVRRCLGTGGMGAIYEVVHHETQRRCVLKTMLGSLLTDTDMRARFKLEATVTANIESDHIVDVYDAGVDDSTGLPFLVMEYLRGETLANRLRTAGRLPLDEAQTLLLQASRVLDRTHSAGIVHRDLKPENLFVTQRDDGTSHLKLLDFGIAKIVAQSTNINTTRSFGTPLYMSPEQIRGDGDIDGRADLYALGQIAYTVLVGHAYFEPEVLDQTSVYPLLLKVMQGTNMPASERARQHGVALPATFDAWFAKATHADASQRFDTAVEQLAALSAALSCSPAVIPKAAESTQATLVSEAEVLPARSQDLVTCAGISRSGNHALREPGKLPSRRSLWLMVVLGLSSLTLVGLYLQSRREKPSDTSAAIAATFEPAAPRTALGAGARKDASAELEPMQSQGTSLPSGAPSATPDGTGIAKTTPSPSPGTGIVEFTPSPSPRKRTSTVSQREATRLPSSSAKRPRTSVNPGPASYDPSDIR